MGNLNSNMLYIRVDGDHLIGVGHIMRCLAIAESWRAEGGSVSFLVKKIPNATRMRLLKEQMQVIELPLFEEISKEMSWIEENIEWKSSVLILDGYHFMEDYQLALKQYFHLIVIDDYSHAEHYYADIILNRNLIAEEKLYMHKKEHATKLLLGMQYNFVRAEFRKYRRSENAPIAKQIKKVLINFGGADAQNYTEKTLRAFEKILDIHLTVVVGPAYQHIESLKHALKLFEGRVCLFQSVDNLAEIMSKMDVAIIAAGTTLFEAAYMGIPAIAVKTAQNQHSVSVFAQKYNGTIMIDATHEIDENQLYEAWRYILSATNRQLLIQNGQKIVDDFGNQRILDEIKQLLTKE